MSSTSITTNTCYTTKVIVLTGASGYLGQHCLRELIENGYDANNDPAIAVDSTQLLVGADGDKTQTTPSSLLIIYALVHQSSSKMDLSEAISSYYDTSCNEQIKRHYKQNVTVITVALDLTSPTACDEWFESLRSSPLDSSSILTIDCCIHTAALSSPQICEQQSEYAMSINVPTYFLQKLFLNNPKIVIIALSTDQVYDGNITAMDGINSTGSNFYNESSICEPCNVYGTSKVELEKYLTQQQQLHYPLASVLLLRSSIMLGHKVPYLPNKAHTTFLHFCHSRIHESTTYYTNEIRSVIAVSDVTRVIVQMMSHYVTITTTTTDQNEKGRCEIYCMGGPIPVNRYEMAKAVLSYFHVTDPSNDIAVPVLKETSQNTSTGIAIVKSPLNISMDSTKLLQFMNDITTTSSDKGNIKFLSLSDIVVQTFSDQY